MFVEQKRYGDCYKTIVSASRGSASSKTYLLVSPDVDAVCAARQLHALLKADYVPNTVIPVSSWSQLESLHSRLEGEDVSSSLVKETKLEIDAQVSKIRSLVLINVGALIDVAAYFSYLPPDCIIHVIDSHRPVNLANLFSYSAYATAKLEQAAAPKGDKRGALAKMTPELSVIVWGDGEERADLREAYDALLVSTRARASRREGKVSNSERHSTSPRATRKATIRTIQMMTCRDGGEGTRARHQARQRDHARQRDSAQTRHSRCRKRRSASTGRASKSTTRAARSTASPLPTRSLSSPSCSTAQTPTDSGSRSSG